MCPVKAICTFDFQLWNSGWFVGRNNSLDCPTPGLLYRANSANYVSLCFMYVSICSSFKKLMFLFSSGGDGFLIFANRHDIRHLAFDSSYYVELVPDQKGAVALDFDFNSGYIFWTDVIEEEIRRAKMEENPKVEVVANISVDTPDGIAVDWINKKLYWTDTGNDMIEVADFDGTNRLELIKTGLQEPRAIVVHPFIGYVEEYSLINLKRNIEIHIPS